MSAKDCGEVCVDIEKKAGDFSLGMSFAVNSRRIGILGASGCGKSMTLKCIAGIEKPDRGTIRIGERVLYDSGRRINLKPQTRSVGYLFQNYALFPTMTVAENIGAGVKGSREHRRQRIKQMMEKFSLGGLENRYPRQLSGGQQQRVALARILAYEPSVLLLDEPFTALDAYLKDAMQQSLSRMLSEYPGFVILVSHDRDEIYRFCDSLVIMDRGRAAACGFTDDLFAGSVKREAAKLTGCKNFSDIRRLDSRTIFLTDWGVTLKLKKSVPEGTDCIGYRAHDFLPVWGERRENCLAFRLESEARLPFETNYYLYPEEGKKKDIPLICWFVQREKMEEIREKGLPDYLMIDEEKLLFLEKN